MERKLETEHQYQHFAEAFTAQFIQRRDLYARQLEDGSYVRVNQPFTVELMRAHLEGKITLGAYLLSLENTTRFVVLDADTDERWAQTRQLSAELAAQGLPTMLEASRRGGHLWIFFDQPVPGDKARGFGLGLLQVFGMQDLEVYPRQERHVDGPGSLIRIPLGIHRKTGRRYGLVTPDGQLQGGFWQQAERLTHPRPVPPEVVELYQYHPQPVTRKEVNPELDQKYARLKEIPLVEFIGQFVQLRPVASGAIGLCPFHDDHHPSFGVNVKGNYWNCFAGCGGGDIISFWMKLKNVDFPTAVTQLEEMLK